MICVLEHSVQTHVFSQICLLKQLKGIFWIEEKHLHWNKLHFTENLIVTLRAIQCCNCILLITHTALFKKKKNRIVYLWYSLLIYTCIFEQGARSYFCTWQRLLSDHKYEINSVERSVSQTREKFLLRQAILQWFLNVCIINKALTICNDWPVRAPPWWWFWWH